MIPMIRDLKPPSLVKEDYRAGPVVNRYIWGETKSFSYVNDPPKGGIFSVVSFTKGRVLPNKRWDQSNFKFDLQALRAIPFYRRDVSAQDLKRSWRSFARSSGIESYLFSKRKDWFFKQLKFYSNCIFFHDSLPRKIYRTLQKAVLLHSSGSDKWKALFSEMKRLFDRHLSKTWPTLFRSATFLRACASA